MASAARWGPWVWATGSEPGWDPHSPSGARGRWGRRGPACPPYGPAGVKSSLGLRRACRAALPPTARAAPTWGSSSPEVTASAWVAQIPPGQGSGSAWADEPTAVCMPGSSERGTQGLSLGGV